MAVIQKLRNSGIVVVVVIAALVVFVLGDILSGNKLTGLGDNDKTIGVIFGEKIHEDALQPIFEEIVKQQSENNPDFKLDEANRKQIIDQAWSTLVKRKTYEAQIEKSGLVISDQEFNEMVAGEFPIESIKGDPSFQTDGKFDAKKVEQIFKRAKTDASLRPRVAAYVKSLKQQEVEKRYTTYISKAQVKSKIEKEFNYIASSQGATGKAVAINYSTIADKDVKVTDSDLEKYLDAHKEEYKQYYDSRDIQFVVWDIIPSSADTAYAKSEAEKQYTSWSKETKPDTAGADVVQFTSFRELGKDSAEKAMYAPLATLPVNGLLPIMTIEGKYTIIQKLDTKQDSANPFVKVEHILIPMSGELPNKIKVVDSVDALRIANELYAKIKGGSDFGSLVKDYSGDPGSVNTKGVYDWSPASKYMLPFGQWASTHQKGEMGVVRTDYGYHVMRMLENPDRMKVKYRKAVIEVTPGAETIRLVDEASRKFRNSVVDGDLKSFETARDKMGLQPRIKKEIRTEDRQLPGIEQAEDIKTLLFWLFDKERKANDVSSVFPFSTRHMVVIVTNARKAGYAEVADVKEKIEPLVRNELKAEKIREKLAKALATTKNAEEIAQKTGGTTVALDAIKLGSNFIPQLFTEPKILGAAFGVKEKTWSKPIAGNSVVAILWIDKRDKVEIPKTGLEEREDFANNPQFLARRLDEILRNKAEIQDFRYKFPWN